MPCRVPAQAPWVTAAARAYMATPDRTVSSMAKRWHQEPGQQESGAYPEYSGQDVNEPEHYDDDAFIHGAASPLFVVHAVLFDCTEYTIKMNCQDRR